MKKKRKRCINCGARKYTKYLKQTAGKFECKNEGKCLSRGANYKK